MKINKRISFGMLVVSVLVWGIYLQNRIGDRNKINKDFDMLGTQSSELIESYYPKDLVIKVNEGKVAINKKLPYCVVIDKTENSGVVFDGSESLNMGAFTTQPKNFPCKPMAIVGKTFVGGRKDNNEIRAWQIPADFSVEVNQGALLGLKNEYLPKIVEVGQKIYTFLPLIITLLVFPWLMLANFWYSLVVGLTIKLLKMTENPEAKNKYWIALFFGSILSITNTLLAYFNFSQIDFPFAGTIIIGLTSVGYLKWIESQVKTSLGLSDTPTLAGKSDEVEEKKKIKKPFVIKK